MDRREEIAEIIRTRVLVSPNASGAKKFSEEIADAILALDQPTKEGGLELTDEEITNITKTSKAYPKAIELASAATAKAVKFYEAELNEIGETKIKLYKEYLRCVDDGWNTCVGIISKYDKQMEKAKQQTARGIILALENGEATPNCDCGCWQALKQKWEV